MVISLEWGTDVHITQLMPLPLTVYCCSKIQIGLPFWYRLIRVVLEKGPLNRCVCVSIATGYQAWTGMSRSRLTEDIGRWVAEGRGRAPATTESSCQTQTASRSAANTNQQRDHRSVLETPGLLQAKQSINQSIIHRLVLRTAGLQQAKQSIYQSITD